jgi:TonB family protein
MTLTATCRLLATLLLSLTLAPAVQAAEPEMRTELQACADPEFPRESFKYGLAGNVQLGFDLSAAGVVDNITMLKGTGWDALDAAAIAALAKCQFSAEVAASKKKFMVNYVFKTTQLNPGVSLPTMRADTCPASEIFSGFVPSRDENIGKVDGLLVRFDVDDVGRAHGVEFESRVWDQRILSAALDYVQACRYNPSKRAGVKSKGAMSGRLTLRAAVGK